ncbi:retrovirus-related pol polyprotein from transposon TNT 1-94 [Tanacetum coccineum]|uniref:Retrovirus-related pol polyprotein from transposon TNT 1-94 n=1 Tax=Tanacetum coccineum TaxID=301880 RepID=A0ABQ5E8G3_9ASTR
MSQEKEAQKKFHKTCEDKELEKDIALENKIKILDDIVYKIGQSVQTMNMLNRNCNTSFVKPEFLMKSQRANPHLYDIGCYNDNLTLMLAPESDKTIRLAQESPSKLSDLIKPFDYKNLNNLYDLFVPQREKSSEQRYFSERSKMSHTPVKNENSKESFNKQTTVLEKRMYESISWDQKCKSSKELFKIKSSVDTIFDGVERCKQTIAKRTYFGHVDPFIQNTIEEIFCPQIQKINGDLENFHLCLNEEMVADLRYFNSLEHEVDSLKFQLETKKHDLKAQLQDKEIAISELKKLIEKIKGKSVETKFEKPSVIRQPNAFKSQRQSVLGVISTTSVSRPQLKSNRLKDRVMHNNSEGKKQQVEDHRWNFKFSNNKTSVTACNDSLNAKTSNVNFFCVTCGKCVLNDNHDMCVLYYINGVNSRTKIPMAVPISTKEPKRIVNQYATTPLKRIITPPGYKWKPKSKTVNVEPNVSMHLGTKSRNTNISEPTTLRKSIVSNTPSSSNSFAACSDNFIHRRLWVLKAHDGKSQASKSGSRDVTIKRVYYVKGLNHNLFSFGQFCDADLEVAFQKSTCYICDLKGNDLLTGSHGTDLYSITLQDTSTPNPICLMAEASSLQAWVESFNGKKYVLVIVDDYSRYTWTHFLRSQDETPEVLIDFLKLVQRGLHAQNRTLVEAARTMLSTAKVPLFFWVEAIATTCFTQNRSLVIPRHEKKPYHIINGWKPSVKFFHIFGSLCYNVRDGENLDKMKEKGNACIFVGYSNQSRAYRVYNKRTKVIVETIHVNFDKLPQMTSDHVSFDPVPQCSTTALEQDSLSLGPQSQENVPHSVVIVTTSNELDLLFSLMFDELLNGTTPVVSKSSTVTTADAHNQRQQQHTTPSTSTTVAADTHPLNIQTTHETTSQAPTQAPTVTANENINQAKTNKEYAQVDEDEFINIFSTPVQERGETSSRYVDSSNMHTFYQRHPSEHRQTKDHPLE